MVSDARYRALMAPGWVRDALWARAGAVPTLDLDFAGSRSLVDRISGQQLITFTRASSATVIGPTGAIETAATDVPRFQFDPTTGRCLGLLVEEQRVNSIRNNTMQGAVAGTPGTLPTNWTEAIAAGLTREIVAVGTVNGINYIEIRISGTTADTVGWSLSFDSSTATAASSGQAWTTSAYVAIVAGSTANMTTARIRTIERGAAGAYITETSSSWDTAPSALTQASRVSVTRAPMGASTQFVTGGLVITANSGVAIDITLRIGLPQLEQGAFATSVIPTTGTAATRSGDLPTITGANFSRWYNQAEGAFYCETQSVPTAPGANIVSADDGSSSQRILVTKPTASSGARLIVTTGGVTQASITTASVFDASPARVAASYASNAFAIVSGSNPVVTDAAGTVPTPTQLSIGSHASAGWWNAPIARICYWSRPFANLESMTR